MRLYKGHDIHQVSDALKADVPDEIKNQARDMARKELAARLAQIDLTNGEASTYSGYHDSVQSHVHQLVVRQLSSSAQVNPLSHPFVASFC